MQSLMKSADSLPCLVTWRLENHKSDVCSRSTIWCFCWCHTTSDGAHSWAKFQYSEDVESEQIQRRSSLKHSRREQSRSKCWACHCLIILEDQLNFQLRRDHQPGWLHCLSKIKVSQCTKANSRMPYVWGMGGFHTTCQKSVNVAVLPLSTMPSTVPRVLFQPSGTMSLGISRVTSSLKCAPMSALNQFCRRWEMRPSTICLQIKRIMQDWTSERGFWRSTH